MIEKSNLVTCTVIFGRYIKMLPFTFVNYFDTVKSCNSKAIFESLQSPDTLFTWHMAVFEKLHSK